MVVLGVLLVLLAAGVTAVAVLGAPGTRVEFELGGFSVSMGPLWVFLTGAATVLLLVLGLELMRAGARRANKRRKEKKELNRLADQGRDGRRDGPAGPGDTRAGDTGRTDTRTTTSDGDVTGPDRPAR